MTMNLPGLHHITAIAADPRRNVAFYTGVLGLRLVKKTVNFDDPTTYHLYYGDSVGTPGSILTFFPWAGLARGRVDTGQASATAFSVAVDALPFWQARLRENGIPHDEPVARFEDQVIAFEDPDGLRLELVATTAADGRTPWTHPEIPSEFAIRGFHSVTLAVNATAATSRLLTEVMGYRAGLIEGPRSRFSTGDVVHSVFESVLWDLGAFAGRTEEAFVGYLATVVRNRILDALRFHQAAQRDGRLGQALTGEFDAEGSEADPAEFAAATEEAARLLAAIAKFEPRVQHLLRARIEGLASFRELAEQLGVGPAELRGAITVLEIRGLLTRRGTLVERRRGSAGA